MSRALEIADLRNNSETELSFGLTYSSVSDLLSNHTNYQNGQIVNLTSYHEGLFSGGGMFTWDASRDKSLHNGGTIIDPDIAFPTDWTNSAQVIAWFTPGTGTGCWIRENKSQYKLVDMGLKGDGVTNDSIAFNYLLSTDGIRFTSDTRHYVLDGTHTIDVDKISIDFGNSLLDFSSMGATSAFTIVGTVNPPYTHVKTVLENAEMVGPAKLLNSICLDFNDETSVGDASSHTKFSNINVHGFWLGHRYRSRAYLLTFDNCDVWDCTYSVWSFSGGTDYGEQIRWFGGTLYNCTNGIKHDNPDGEINFFGTSIDYNGVICEVTAGKLDFNSAHIEAGDYATTPIVITGDGSSVNINGGWLLETAALPHTHSYFASVAATCLLTIDGTKVNNIRSLVSFSTGTGIVKMNKISTYNVHENDFILNDGYALNYDVGFEGTVVPPSTFITDDTVAITDQTTGSNVVLALGVTLPRTGTQSLEYTKAGGAGSLSEFVLARGKVNPGDMIGHSLWYRKNGTTTGSIDITFRFSAVVLNEVLGTYNTLTETIGVTTETFTAADSGWVKVEGQATATRVPEWATHYDIVVSGFNWAAVGDTMYFDDVYVSKIG